MNYKIITDEPLLKGFIDWLPELQPNEMYYVTLFARKKYCPALPSDKAQLKRFTSNKDLLFSKIKQLECEIGSYTIDNIVIPNEALALYISINPRNLVEATKKALKSLLDLVLKPYNGFNPQSEILTQIQKSSGTRHFHDFDFDNVDISETLKEVDKIIPSKYYVLQTRSGFHILVPIKDLTDADRKVFFNISKLKGCDVKSTNGTKNDETKGDSLVPVVGCMQGGFTPILYKPQYEYILS